MKQIIHIFVFSMLISLMPTFARAGVLGDYFDAEDKGRGPIEMRNQMPLLTLFYVMPLTTADTVGKGEVKFNTRFDITQVFEQDNNGLYFVNFDQEIYRTTFQFTYGIFENVDLRLEIPTLGFGNGFLDEPVFDYHEIFGFEQAGRDLYPFDQYGYFVGFGNQTVYNVPSKDFGLSDITLDIKYQILEDKEWWPALAVRAGLKLPTGKYEVGTGSGELDYGFGFVLSKSFHRFHFFTGMDGIIIEDPEPLRSFIDHEIIHYFFGLDFAAVKDNFSIILQIDGQTTPYVPTGLSQFDNEVLDIVLGFKGAHFDEKFWWDLSIREDLIADSTTDFTVGFSLGTKF